MSPAELYDLYRQVKDDPDTRSPMVSQVRCMKHGTLIEGTIYIRDRKVWVLGPTRHRNEDGWTKVPGRAYLSEPPADEPRGCRQGCRPDLNDVGVRA